jgi:hypothetical protein
VPPPSATSSPTNAESAEHVPQTAAQALRASEPAAPPDSTPPALTQGIALRIALPDAPPVDVQVMERAGQVQVAVRTPDTGLQSSLRQDLGTLVNSLERSGFRAEALAPHDDIPQAVASSPISSPTSSQDGGQRQDRAPGEPGHSSGNQHSGNQNGHRSSQQQQSQQEQHGRRPQNWIETMENIA